jgi:uridine phosphorylase
VTRSPIHLHPTAPLADRVLLPGDPGRALLLAQELLTEPKMFNHHRGLWGYTGAAADGEPLTIQSTGMGGPSAAIVLSELCDLGIGQAIRVGTCGALDGALALGTLIAASDALCADGTSRALGAGDVASGDASLTAAIAAVADTTARIATTDLFYDPDPSREEAWRAAGAVAVEMEAAALFTLGATRGIAVACLLTVSDTLGPDGRERIADEALVEASTRLGHAATTALLR